MQESRISEIQSEMQCPNLLATRLSPPWRFRFRFAVCTRPMQGLEDIRATESADLTHDIGVGIAKEVVERPRPRCIGKTLEYRMRVLHGRNRYRQQQG